jgi:hypothetical protein
MPKFIADDSLLPFTGNKELEVPEGTMKEVLLHLFNTYPQLYVYLLDEKELHASRYVLVLNDEELIEESDLSKNISAEDTLELLEIVPSGLDAGTIGAAVINAVAGAGAATATGILSQIIGYAILTGVMLALNMVIGALMGDVEMPNLYSGSLDNSASYTFTGIKNTTASGTPVQIVYGKHRTGGQVLALFTESEDTNTRTAEKATSISTDIFLFYQLGMSEGEVAGIQDVEINKLPATFYSAVHTVGTTSNPTDYFRTGTSAQTVMNGFNKIMNTTSIGRKVLTLPGSKLLNTTVVFTEHQPMYGIIWGEHVASWLAPRYGVYKPGMYKPEFIYVPDYEYSGQ